MPLEKNGETPEIETGDEIIVMFKDGGGCVEKVLGTSNGSMENKCVKIEDPRELGKTMTIPISSIQFLDPDNPKQAKWSCTI